MSYILEALRKADAERERGAVPDLHAQALPLSVSDAEVDSPRPSAGLWLGLGVGLAAVAGAAWYLLGRDESAPVAPAVATVAAPPLAAPAPPAPVAPPAAAAPPWRCLRCRCRRRSRPCSPIRRRRSRSRNAQPSGGCQHAGQSCPRAEAGGIRAEAAAIATKGRAACAPRAGADVGRVARRSSGSRCRHWSSAARSTRRRPAHAWWSSTARCSRKATTWGRNSSWNRFARRRPSSRSAASASKCRCSSALEVAEAVMVRSDRETPAAPRRGAILE